MDLGQLAVRGQFRLEQGLLWPAYDKRCAEVTFRETAEMMDRLRPHLAGGVAVQAGGNCGQLVRELADHYSAVYTFEPDALNFVALSVNTASRDNVFRFQAALGSQPGAGVSLADGDARFPGRNCGALYVAGGGNIPTVSLDSFQLAECAFILLDVEGAEARAIDGAYNTIERCSPLVVIEDKGLGERFYGEPPHAAERMLVERHGYRRLWRVGNDTALAR